MKGRFKDCDVLSSLQFDPAVQRFMSMRATNFDHFKVTPKTTWFGFLYIVLPVGLLTYISTKDKVGAIFTKIIFSFFIFHFGP